jgi:hypothetical protein
VCNNTDNRSILLHLLKLHLNFLLASISVILGSILGESLLLAFAPVLVEPSPHFLAKMLSPNRVECAETAWSLYVSHKTNNDKRRCLNDGNSLTGFLLVEFCRISNRQINDICASTDLLKQTKRVDRTLKIERMEKVQVYILDPGFSTSRTIWVMPAL